MTNLDISRVLLAGASVRAAAESAHAAGYQVIAVDLFADSDTQDVATCEAIQNYPDDIASLIGKYQPDGVCITGALENYPDLIQRIRCQTNLLAPPTPLLAKIREPKLLSSLLSQAGFHYPEIGQSSNSQVKRWLLKPYQSAAGHRIQFHQPTEQVPDTHYFQEYIEGKSMGANFLIQSNQAILLGTVEHITSHDNFEFHGAIVSSVPPTVEHDLLRLGTLLNHLGLRGLLGVDFLLTDDNQITILEINPRYTASMELLEPRWQAPLLEYHIKAFTEHPFPIQATADAYLDQLVHGKRIVYANQSLHIDLHQLHAFQQVAAQSSAILSDIPQVGNTIETGHPVLTIRTSSKSLQQTQNDLARITHQIQAAARD